MQGVGASQQAGAEGLAIQKANNAVAEATQKAAQDEDNRSNMVKSMISKAKIDRF
jgi:hypothetical protein